MQVGLLMHHYLYILQDMVLTSMSLGLQISGAGTLIAGINFIVTIINDACTWYDVHAYAIIHMDYFSYIKFINFIRIPSTYSWFILNVS